LNWVCALILLALSLNVFANESTKSNPLKPTVIVLSWDGMRFDFPDRDKYPGLQRLEKEGVRAKSLIPVYPSSTFPTHVSMATGALPGVHGIMDNQFYDQQKGHYSYNGDAIWLDAEPVWISAERQGIKSATFFWVSSDTDWQGQGTSYRIAPFDDATTEVTKVDQIISWIDLPESERPQLIMSYWQGADDVAHSKGPMHPDVDARIHEQDKQLVRLLDALDNRNLWASTTLIIVSDHGMSEVNQVIDIDSIIKESGIEVIISGRNAVKHLFLDSSNSDRYDSDQKSLIELLSKVPNIKVFARSELPESFNFVHPTRTGDIVVTTEAPYLLTKKTFILEAQKLIAPIMGWKAGAHGYSVHHTEMHSIFFAMGRGVNSDLDLGHVNQLQIAPTITDLLGIEPPLHATGSPIQLD